ncbi:MAG: metal-dependent hydrolase [Patescibacteria group bacterium]|nr:metal-dependent hydrolase [Patescibacteria group bacterium]
MFIGHLPAGYILTKTLQKKLGTSKYLFFGLLGSVIADIDILYFYLIDNRQNLHHGYWIHIPFYWMMITLVTILFFWILKKKDYIIASIIFFSNIFLHLFLDTIVGKVEWLYPLTDKGYYLFDVPAVYDFWVWNFVFHWTFLFEVGLVVWAVVLFVKSKTESSTNKTL